MVLHRCSNSLGSCRRVRAMWPDADQLPRHRFRVPRRPGLPITRLHADLPRWHAPRRTDPALWNLDQFFRETWPESSLLLQLQMLCRRQNGTPHGQRLCRVFLQWRFGSGAWCYQEQGWIENSWKCEEANIHSIVELWQKAIWTRGTAPSIWGKSGILFWSRLPFSQPEFLPEDGTGIIVDDWSCRIRWHQWRPMGVGWGFGRKGPCTGSLVLSLSF